MDVWCASGRDYGDPSSYVTARGSSGSSNGSSGGGGSSSSNSKYTVLVAAAVAHSARGTGSMCDCLFTCIEFREYMWVNSNGGSSS